MDFVPFVWTKACNGLHCLGFLFMEKAEGEEGTFPLWLPLPALTAALDLLDIHSAFLAFPRGSGSALTSL